MKFRFEYGERVNEVGKIAHAIMMRKLSGKAGLTAAMPLADLRDEINKGFEKSFPGHRVSSLELINALRKHPCLGFACSNDGNEEAIALGDEIVSIYNIVAKKTGHPPLRLVA